MKLKKFDTPQCFIRRGADLDISSENLPILMHAVLDRNLPFRFRARGNSMKPFIQNGDVITIKPLPDKYPEIGDVNAFVDPETEKLVVHRIVAQKNGRFLFLGDNVLGKSDGLIPMNNLIGKVEHVERNGRHVKLGLGPERFIIAFISHIKLELCILLRKLPKIFHSPKNKS